VDVWLDEQAVLMFTVNPEKGGVLINLEVSINGHAVKGIGFREGTMHARYIIFNAGGILSAGTNRIAFRYHGLGLSLSIDEVVLLFHRDIELPSFPWVSNVTA
jgi:hypothetical protein